MADMELVVQHNGQEHRLRLEDCTARDATECRRATGLSLSGLFSAARDDFDIDVLAAVVWLSRRHAGEAVSYEQVADGIKYSDDIDVSQGDDEEEDTDPET